MGPLRLASVINEPSDDGQSVCFPLHLQPVNLFPPNSAGFYDSYGNVWEWLEDQFNGLPGFKTNFLYEDFSTPSYDGLHTMMLVG